MGVRNWCVTVELVLPHRHHTCARMPPLSPAAPGREVHAPLPKCLKWIFVCSLAFVPASRFQRGLQRDVASFPPTLLQLADLLQSASALLACSPVHRLAPRPPPKPGLDCTLDRWVLAPADVGRALWLPPGATSVPIPAPSTRQLPPTALRLPCVPHCW
jgi:hypothetical protein